MFLTICTLTYHRDEGLERLLQSIRALELPLGVVVSVTVVDNACRNEVKTLCETFSENTSLRIRYFAEEKNGISFARNKALRELEKECDYVAFVDDDEEFDTQWIIEMHKAISRYPADVWNAPVISAYPDHTPEWIIRGKYFERKIFDDGFVKNTANTGNVLFRKDILDRITPWFDDAYALSGGEDTDFFNRVHAKGMKIVWVKNAIAKEWIERKRLNARWIIGRYFRSVSNLKRIKLNKSRYPSALRSKYILTGLLQFVLGLCSLPLLTFVFIRREWAMFPLLKIAVGCAYISSIFSWSYSEYK